MRLQSQVVRLARAQLVRLQSQVVRLLMKLSNSMLPWVSPMLHAAMLVPSVSACDSATRSAWGKSKGG